MRQSSHSMWTAFAVIAAAYVLLIVAMVLASGMAVVRQPELAWTTCLSPEVRDAAILSMWTSLLSATLAIAIALPSAWLISRRRFPLRGLVDVIFDVPVFLPPLVVGLCLLILVRTWPISLLDDGVGVALHVPAIVLAQTVIAVAFAYRPLHSAIEQIPPRTESIAAVMGCSPWQTFRLVVLPTLRAPIIAAFLIAWARSIGEFGPILIFAGATRGKTEVLPTSIYLELTSGNLAGAVAISLMMIVIAVTVLIAVRFVLRPGQKSNSRGMIG